MKKITLLIAAMAMTLALSSAAVADEIYVLEAPQADTDCTVRVVTVTPTMALSKVIELVPEVIEVRTFSLDLDLGTDAVEASVSVDTGSRPSAGVLNTVLSALGKALLKVVATLIHHVV
jgi:hypothetical protein